LYLVPVNLKVQPGIFDGNFIAPASKSCMQRACALALLHNGPTVIENPGKSNDDLAALAIIKILGAEVIEKKGLLYVQSLGVNPVANSVNCGESGLAARMFAPIAALCKVKITITGEGSLLKRPMHFFEEILPQLAVTIKTNNGFLPLHIKGPLQSKDITIDGSVSSQYLTGLLLAFAHCKKPGTINVKNLKSKPYIDLSLQMMKHFGYTIKNNNYEKFEVVPLSQKQGEKINYTVEGDWSNAAFLLVAGAIAGKAVISNLNIHSAQADKAVLQALELAAADISIKENEISVNKSMLRPFCFDATHCPDLFPPLVALAAYAHGTSVIEGCERLLHKESNRALTLQQEFAKLGVVIAVKDNKMMIEGSGTVNAAQVFSHNDHRIAMACAVAALGAKGAVDIEAAEAINKSYPAFLNHLQLAGIIITKA
jgi:3-phosphoshikimate 1-carboxyvinyltransferase